MNKKRGVTTMVIVLAVLIMFIILTTATVIGSRNIDTVNYEEFVSQINRVSNSVNEYVVKNDEMPITSSVIAKAGLTEDFRQELEENGDLDNDLYVIDMTKLNVDNVSKGKGDISNRDIFVIAENTNNVYYYKGYKFRNTVYYGV